MIIKHYYSLISFTISSIVANLVMEELENNVISKLHFITHFYRRCVDDSLLCIPHNKINYAQTAFNSSLLRLQFLVDQLIDNSINFMDVYLKYNNNETIEPTGSKNCW